MCRVSRFVFLFLLVLSRKAIALPEYAARYNINSCTACHLSPVGGGPRNVDGKAFGAHGYKINPFLLQDYVSADFRALFYYPESPRATKSGAGLMSGSVAGHVALDEENRFHLVIEDNVAGFQQAGLRDTYGLYRVSREGVPAWLESVMLGRFRAPFGLITDEHRTYTRVQSGTEWFAMEAGAMFSGSAFKGELHYDLALLNGENTGAQSLQANGAGRWGAVANLRYMPGPAIFGLSYSFHRHDPANESRTAASLYTVVSFERWSDGGIPVTLEIEHVRARNWGANLGRGFVTDPNYASTLTAAWSQGWLGEVIWRASRKLHVLYKFDWLTPDESYPADNYQRHGLGLRYWVGPGVWFQLRTEVARATHPSEKGGTAVGAQGGSYALLQLAF